MHRRLHQLGGPSMFNAGPSVECPKIVAPEAGLVPYTPETVTEAEPTAFRDADGLLGRLMRWQAESLAPELADKVSQAASSLAEAIAAAEAIEAEVETRG